VDIFFPTDFCSLSSAVAAITGASPRLWRSSDFLAQFGEVVQTRTVLGYNPMLQDYLNTQILTT
jgi:hypothetical protein